MDLLSEIVSVLLFLFGTFLCLITEILNNIRWWFFPKYKDLSSDVVLITGAGNGTGRLMCLEFAKYCPNIVGWDYQKDALEETAKMVLETSGRAMHTYVCDLRFRDQIFETAEKVTKDVGRVTVLVNNAGIVSAKPLLDLKAEEIENTFKVNVISHFYTIQAFLPSMLCAGKLSIENSPGSGDTDSVTSNLSVPRGHIVNIASVAGIVPGAGLSDYCASKAASLLMSQSLECELRGINLQDSIYITDILPFLMNTRMFRGSQPLHPWLFTTVDAAYCARRVVQAVRLNERTVYVTARYRLFPLIQCLCPTETLHNLYIFGGGENFAKQLEAERRNEKAHEE